MRLIFARLIYQFDLTLAPGTGNWIDRQRAFALWEKKPLNVHIKARF